MLYDFWLYAIKDLAVLVLTPWEDFCHVKKKKKKSLTVIPGKGGSNEERKEDKILQRELGGPGSPQLFQTLQLRYQI